MQAKRRGPTTITQKYLRLARGKEIDITTMDFPGFTHEKRTVLFWYMLLRTFIQLINNYVWNIANLSVPREKL